jgi:hypothetical protein
VATRPFFGYLRPWPSSLETSIYLLLDLYLGLSFFVEVVGVRVLLLGSFHLERTWIGVVGEVRVVNALMR